MHYHWYSMHSDDRRYMSENKNYVYYRKMYVPSRQHSYRIRDIHCRPSFYRRSFDARDIYSLLSSFCFNSTNERSFGYITLIAIYHRVSQWFTYSRRINTKCVKQKLLVSLSTNTERTICSKYIRDILIK